MKSDDMQLGKNLSITLSKEDSGIFRSMWMHYQTTSDTNFTRQEIVRIIMREHYKFLNLDKNRMKHITG